jgi:hypothetical protein
MSSKTRDVGAYWETGYAQGRQSANFKIEMLKEICEATAVALEAMKFSLESQGSPSAKTVENIVRQLKRVESL